MDEKHEIKIENIRPKYAKPLAELQRACYSTLGEAELLREEHFLNHCELFPEGNFVALAGRHVVGLGAGFLIDFHFDEPHHTFNEVIAGGYFSNHDPGGQYYYGADISVHPKFRGYGIGAKLYAARKNVVQTMNLRGIVAGGLLPGFARHKHTMGAHEYVHRVIKGELHDSTLSFQLSHGFEVVGLLENYIEDSAADNWSTLIFWKNPHYRPARRTNARTLNKRAAHTHGKDQPSAFAES